MLQGNCTPEKFSVSTNKIPENLCRFAIGRFLSMDIGTASACGMAWFLLALISLSKVEGSKRSTSKGPKGQRPSAIPLTMIISTKQWYKSWFAPKKRGPKGPWKNTNKRRTRRKR
jgi:hypothetical protein